MNLRELLRRVDRLQKSLMFKIIASAVVALAAIASGATYAVMTGAQATDPAVQRLLESPLPIENEDELTPEQARAAEFNQSFNETAGKILAEVRSGQRPVSMVVTAVAAGAGVLIIAVWLGVAITYFSLIAVALLAGLPLMLWNPTEGLGRTIIGVSILTAAFTTLLEGLRLILSMIPGPVSGIARNVLSEAMRMKVSLLFIVMLIGGMALLPGMLHEETPLRYRVQNFLQYSLGGSFWVLASLTVLLATASVAFEQRDRLIWQTMTKPVAPWKYLLGKWLGATTLAAVLLVVMGTAVFLFTEHLRGQTAIGEIKPFVAEAGTGRIVSEDRAVLTYQVLQARRVVEPEPPFERDDPDFLTMVRGMSEERASGSEYYKNTEAEFKGMTEELYKQFLASHRAIAPGQVGRYVFKGLGSARHAHKPLTLRYKIRVGSNRPDDVYGLVMQIGSSADLAPRFEQARIDQVAVIEGIAPQAVDDNGEVVVLIQNLGLIGKSTPPETISLEAGAFQLAYSVGGYELNLARTLWVMWVKLAFLAAVAVAVAAFLSFPVACLISFGTLIMAEGAGYISKSVEYYGSGSDEGAMRLLQLVVHPIGRGVSWVFSTYHEINPVGRLVEGKLIPWSELGTATGLMLFWAGVIYGLGVLIFRRRELALYSGQ